MKNKLKKLTLLGTVIFLLAFTSRNIDKDLIGSWKVETVQKNDGTTKKGRKTLTFSSDHSFISVKDNGTVMKGFWKLDRNTKILRMSDELKEKWIDFQIINLTKNELVLKDERKNFITSKKSLSKSKLH